jgi:hypothetical protein
LGSQLFGQPVIVHGGSVGRSRSPGSWRHIPLEAHAGLDLFGWEGYEAGRPLREGPSVSGPVHLRSEIRFRARTCKS